MIAKSHNSLKDTVRLIGLVLVILTAFAAGGQQGLNLGQIGLGVFGAALLVL